MCVCYIFAEVKLLTLPQISVVFYFSPCPRHCMHISHCRTPVKCKAKCYPLEKRLVGKLFFFHAYSREANENGFVKFMQLVNDVKNNCSIKVEDGAFVCIQCF